MYPAILILVTLSAITVFSGCVHSPSPGQGQELLQTPVPTKIPAPGTPATETPGSPASAITDPGTPAATPGILLDPAQEAAIMATPVMVSPPKAQGTTEIVSARDLESKGSIDKTYYYIIDGTPGYIPFNVYTGVNDYITTLGNIYSGDDYNALVSNGI